MFLGNHKFLWKKRCRISRERWITLFNTSNTRRFLTKKEDLFIHAYTRCFFESHEIPRERANSIKGVSYQTHNSRLLIWNVDWLLNIKYCWYIWIWKYAFWRCMFIFVAFLCIFSSPVTFATTKNAMHSLS